MKPQRDWIGEWVSKNDGFVRIMPILVGGVSLLAVLLNRAFSGIAPVADASRSLSLFQFSHMPHMLSNKCYVPMH